MSRCTRSNREKYLQRKDNRLADLRVSNFLPIMAGIRTMEQYTKQLKASIGSNSIETIFETEEPTQAVGSNRVDTFVEIDAAKRKDPHSSRYRSVF
jgi:hypothetical protein